MIIEREEPDEINPEGVSQFFRKAYHPFGI